MAAMSFEDWPLEEIISCLSFERWPPDELVSCLSYRPDHMLKGMIPLSVSPKPSAIQRDPVSSSIGLLGTLPPELLHFVFNMLDFQSLSRVSRVSLQGRAVVSSLPVYQSLQEHVPDALAVLNRTKLIGLHSVATLYATLKSEKCIACDHYGPFLFLPTCERCCYSCLAKNPSLWVMTTALATKCFGLTSRQLMRLPLLHSIPGVYSIRCKISRQRSRRLVSVRAAKELAIMVHGSAKKMAHAVAARQIAFASPHELFVYKYLQNASLNPQSQDPSTLPTYHNTPADDSCGMASIPFPSLSTNNALENGLWCRGCEFRDWGYTKLPYLLSYLYFVPVDRSPYWVFRELQDRARSRAEFLDHITHCRGRDELMFLIMKGESEQKD